MVIFYSRVGGMNVKLGGSEIGRTNQKLKVLRMKLPISGHVPRPAGSVLRAFPASHGPYAEKKKIQKIKKSKISGKIPVYAALFRRLRVPWLAY